MDSTFERVVEILRDKCELDETVEITMDTTFKDIDLDSLSVVEIDRLPAGITITEAKSPGTDCSRRFFIHIIYLFLAIRPIGECWRRSWA